MEMNGKPRGGGAAVLLAEWNEPGLGFEFYYRKKQNM